jgi:hypothetical protein
VQSTAFLQSVGFAKQGICWCHKVWYHVTMIIVSMMVWFLIDSEEEVRVAHLTTYTRLALSRSLCDSYASASLTTWGFCVIHCLRPIHCLRLLRHSFTSYSICEACCLRSKVSAKRSTERASVGFAVYRIDPNRTENPYGSDLILKTVIRTAYGSNF